MKFTKLDQQEPKPKAPPRPATPRPKTKRPKPRRKVGREYVEYTDDDIRLQGEIIDAVAQVCCCSKAYMLSGHGRAANMVAARRLVTAFVREHTNITFVDIARKMGQVHASVIGGHKEFWKCVGGKVDSTTVKLPDINELARRVENITGLPVPTERKMER